MLYSTSHSVQRKISDTLFQMLSERGFKEGHENLEETIELNDHLPGSQKTRILGFLSKPP